MSNVQQQGVPQDGWFKNQDGIWEVIVNQEIQDVTPEMIDWWWDHMDTTERYKLWHPTDHLSFEWIVPPAQGHVGAIHRVHEKFGAFIIPPLNLRWEDPQSQGIATTFSHIIAATAYMGDEGTYTTVKESGCTVEYEAIPGGTRMRSHYYLPGEMPEVGAAALHQHDREEMQNLPIFLPALYKAEADK